MSSSPSSSPAGASVQPAVLSYATPVAKPSDWSPLRNRVFLALWLAATVSYVGFEIRNYAAPLWMIDAKQTSSMSALTQTASTIAIPFLVLIAGALADVVDRRKLLIVTHVWMMATAALLGLLTLLHLMTPWLLLAFLFAIGAGYAMANPALLAVLPETVDPSELKSALALNSVSLNIARVLGPAVGGVIIAIFSMVPGGQGAAGKGAAFLATGLSVAGVVWVLARWRPATRQKPANPETIWGAVRTGFRYAWYTPRLRAILLRVLLFIACAGVLGLFAAIIGRRALHLTDGKVGAMMACMGVGAIVGVYFMQPMQRRFGVEESVAICSAAYALGMVGVALAPSMPLACLAMIVAGFNWVIVPTSFNIATQQAVPAWVKGRAMGMYVLVLQGSLSLGPAIFGKVADVIGARHPGVQGIGPRHALIWAAVGVMVGMAAIVKFRLQPRTKEDLSPAKLPPIDRPESIIDPAAGVRVMVEYRVSSAHRDEFRHRMHELHAQRRRNGAVHWHLGETGGHFIETFEFHSWLDRVRHHERTTKADAVLEDRVLALHEGGGLPSMRYVARPSSVDQSCCPWIGAIGAGMGRECVRFFDRMERARERDRYRGAWKREEAKG